MAKFAYQSVEVAVLMKSTMQVREFERGLPLKGKSEPSCTKHSVTD
jgi:hypothetical protein